MKAVDIASLTALALLGIAVGLSRDAVEAVGTGITAIATAVIAVFSIGTWKLYRLEKQQHESRLTRLYSRLVLLRGNVRSYANLLKRVPQEPGKAYSVLHSLIVPIETRVRELDGLMDDALGTNETVLANLSAAEISLEQTLLIMKAAVQRATTEDEETRLEEGPERAVRIAEKLEEIYAGLNEAVGAIPEPEEGTIASRERFLDLLQDRVERMLAPETVSPDINDSQHRGE
jgi:hypothetical protein